MKDESVVLDWKGSQDPLLNRVFFVLYAVALMVSTAAMEILAWSNFLLFVVALISDLKTKKWNKENLLLGCEPWIWGLFVVACMGAFVGPTQGGMDVIGFFRWILLLYAFTYLLRTRLRNSVLLLFVGLMAGAIFASLTAYDQFFTGFDFIRPHVALAHFGSFFRAKGTFSVPGTFAYVFGQVCILMLALGLSADIKTSLRKYSKFLWITAGLVMVAVIFTLTRAAWLALVLCFLGMTFYVNRKMAMKLTGGIVAVILATFIISTPFHDRILSFVDTHDSSNMMRMDIWRANWAIFKDHPLVGVGLGENSKLVKTYYEKLGMNATFVSHAHSNYLQFLSGTGAIGLILYLALGFFFLRSVFVASLRLDGWPALLALGLCFSQIYVHIGGLTECNFTDLEVNHMLIFSWALVGHLSRQAKDSKLDGEKT